jgi:hypothetical protein
MAEVFGSIQPILGELLLLAFDGVEIVGNITEQIYEESDHSVVIRKLKECRIPALF